MPDDLSFLISRDAELMREKQRRKQEGSAGGGSNWGYELP